MVSNREAQKKRLEDLSYIECDGVRVPVDWTISELRTALSKRKIRFQIQNEKEIMKVFGEAINLKALLEERIASLTEQAGSLEAQVKALKAQGFCPYCRKMIFNEIQNNALMIKEG